MKNTARRADIVWLTPKRERERTGSTDEQGLHLSRSQKWDLVRICTAAIASAAFFSAPFLLSTPQRMSSVGTAVPTPSARTEHGAVTEDAPGRVSVVTADVAVPVATVLTRALPFRSARPATRSSHLSAASRTRIPATESAGFARRLGRAIAGDGRYTVRPFPALDPNHD